MLKISVAESDSHSRTLHLEGQLSGPWVEELERVCGKFVTEGCQLKLELADVTFVDRAGALLLASLAARDVALAGCSPYVGEQLRLIQKEFLHKYPRTSPLEA